jgi:hypothetical protein
MSSVFAFFRWIRLIPKRQKARSNYKHLDVDIMLRLLKKPDSDTLPQLWTAFINKAKFSDLMFIVEDKEHQYQGTIREMAGKKALYLVETSPVNPNMESWLNPSTGRVFHLISIVTCLPNLRETATRVSYCFIKTEQEAWRDFLRQGGFPDGTPPLRVISN